MSELKRAIYCLNPEKVANIFTKDFFERVEKASSEDDESDEITHRQYFQSPACLIYKVRVEKEDDDELEFGGIRIDATFLNEPQIWRTAQPLKKRHAIAVLFEFVFVLNAEVFTVLIDPPAVPKRFENLINLASKMIIEISDKLELGYWAQMLRNVEEEDRKYAFLLGLSPLAFVFKYNVETRAWFTADYQLTGVPTPGVLYLDHAIKPRLEEVLVTYSEGDSTSVAVYRSKFWEEYYTEIKNLVISWLVEYLATGSVSPDEETTNMEKIKAYVRKNPELMYKLRVELNAIWNWFLRVIDRKLEKADRIMRSWIYEFIQHFGKGASGKLTYPYWLDTNESLEIKPK